MVSMLDPDRIPIFQETEAQNRLDASRQLASDIRQYKQELYEAEIAKRKEQESVRLRLQAQVHEIQQQRDAAAAEVRPKQNQL